MKHFFKLLYVLSILVTIGLMPRSAWAQQDGKFAVRAEALIKDYFQSGLFTGTVLIARDGKPILRKGFGDANREWAMPNAPNTKFRLASLGKQFTAAAILRLADEHKLELDEPLKTYLSDVPASWDQVTLRELLAHTSGIPSYTGYEDFDAKLLPLKHTPEQLLALVKDAPLYFEPGTKFRYSNTGYILLGRVIETVSGLRYQDYLEQQLLRPLHLANTGYDDGRKVLANAAQAYTDGVNGVVKPELVDMSNAYAAGAVYATVDDLLAWQQLLMNGKVLSAESTAAMFADGGHGNGLGWLIGKRHARKVIAHDGDLNGFHTTLAYYPQDKLTIVILSNYSDELVSKLSGELAGLAFGVPPAHRQVSVDRQQYARFEGRFQLCPDHTFTILRRGDRLFAQVTRQKQFEILPESQFSYFYKGIDAVLTFDDASEGRAQYLTLHQHGNQLKAMRID